jgi:hypothetical protein
MDYQRSTLVSILYRTRSAKVCIRKLETFVATGHDNEDTVDSKEEVTPLGAALSRGDPEILAAFLKKWRPRATDWSALREELVYHEGLPARCFNCNGRKDGVKEKEELLTRLQACVAIMEKYEREQQSFEDSE